MKENWKFKKLEMAFRFEVQVTACELYLWNIQQSASPFSRKITDDKQLKTEIRKESDEQKQETHP